MITMDVVLGYALRDPRVMNRLGEALKSDLANPKPSYRRIAGFAEEFLRERRRLPGDGDWALWLESLPEPQRDGTREALQRLRARRDFSEFEPGHFGERVLEFLRRTAAATALSRANALGEVTPEALTSLAEEVEAVRGADLSGLADVRDVDVWAHGVGNEILMPTGFPSLDRAIGGWGPELWITFADSGVGKSMLLANFAAAAALRGKNALIVTLELAARPLIHRFYRRIAEADRAAFARDLEKVKADLRHWFRFADGNVWVLEFPAYSLDPHQLLRTVERVDRLHGVDLLVLDYLDLMTLPPGERSRGRYEDLGRITHTTRSICPAHEVPVLTASQAVRKADRDRLTLADMGDSYEKVRGADGVLGLVQSAEEEEVHQGRLSVLKARESRGRTDVPLYVERDLALIAELDHPNTVRLMRERGHLTARPEPGKTPEPAEPTDGEGGDDEPKGPGPAGLLAGM